MWKQLSESFLLLLVCTSFFIPSVHAGDTLAYVASTRGLAVVWNGRDYRDATRVVPGTAVRPGNIVQTLDDAAVLLIMPNGSEVTIGGAPTFYQWTGTRLNTVSAQLDYGRAEHRVVPTVGQRFQVSTPVATTGTRGTDFSVEVGENGSMRTSVFTSAVAVGDEEDAPLVAAGQSITRDLLGQDDWNVAADDADWLAAQRVTDPAEAERLSQAALARMQELNAQLKKDIAATQARQFLALASMIFGFVQSAQSDRSGIEKVSNAANTLVLGLKLFRQIESRRTRIVAQYDLINELAARFDSVAYSAAYREYRQIARERDRDQEKLDRFISGLEKVALILNVAQAAAQNR